MRRSRSLPHVLALLAVATAAFAATSRAEVERINVEGLGRLPAFSHATVASGQLVFVSGTLGIAPGSPELVAGGVAAQTKQVLENIDRILTAARTNRGNVLQCTVYLVDMTKFSEMNDVWMPFFGDRPPARATIGVQALARDAAVEIECVAQRTVATAG
jgi:2-iminobutanoate/2-iminopropanoate deaminase